MNKSRKRRPYSEGKPADLYAKAHETGPRTRFSPVLAALLVVAVAIGGYYIWQRSKEAKLMEYVTLVTIETSKGQIVLELYPKMVPNTVANFVKLAEQGFYDGLIWHRVEDWVVQTGDPQGTGYGGSDETIDLEINKNLHNVRGAVGMARSSDPNSASSQFYILKKDVPSLDGGYAIFGKVRSGMDVVDRLVVGDKMVKVTVQDAEK